MSDKVEATDEDRDKNIKKDLREMGKRYDAVNSQLGSLKTRMDRMRMDQTESSCVILARLDAILRNSTSQEKPVTDRTQGTELVFRNHNGTNGNQHRYHYPGMRRVEHCGGG